MGTYFYAVEDGVRPFVNERTELEWTKEKPTKAGWYWTIHRIERLMIVEAFFMSRNDDFLSFRSGWDSYSSLDFNNWLGPLPEPQMPD